MAERVRDHLGRFGIWRSGGQVTAELATGVERLGYGTLWLGGSPGGDLTQVEQLLDATTTLTLATGVVNMWKDDARTVAASFARIEAGHPGRFLLGVGTGETLATYVDVLLGDGVPAQSLVLAALGPKVLRLARDRAGGAHPYLVPPEHTRQARSILGDGPLLAPEQKAVLETDPERARAIGRPRLSPYFGMVNYTSNLRRLGWSDEDLSGGGSNALTDALVAHGSGDQVAARLDQHFQAGADHVAVQLLTASGADVMDGYRELAQALSL